MNQAIKEAAQAAASSLKTVGRANSQNREYIIENAIDAARDDVHG